MMMNPKWIMGLVLGGASAVTAAVLWCANKVNKMTQKIGVALNDLSDASVKDIQEVLVERSVEKAASRRVDSFARDAENKAVNEMRAQITKAAKEAVESAEGEIVAAVKKEIVDQVAAIDHQALRKEVKKEAKEKAMSKLEDLLNEVQEDFSADLTHVKNIHKAMTDAWMSPEKKNEGKGVTFTIGNN